MESDPIIKDRLTQTGDCSPPAGRPNSAPRLNAQRAVVTAAANALGIKARQ